MTGASSRRRGHNAERAVAAYLRAHGYPDAHTTRAALGHDGWHAPGDVVGPLGLVIEVKDVAASSWPSWCRQAEQEAEGRPWVVVRKQRGIADPGRWPCRWRDAVLGMQVGGPLCDMLAGYDDTFTP